MSLLQVALEPSTLVVAVDPGKVMNRIWVSDGSGRLADPVSLPVSRAGVESLEELLAGCGHGCGGPVIAIEATGSLHRAWALELERRHPGAVRLFRRRRPRPHECSWDRVGSRPTTGTVPR
jgi:hypothetical protein